MFFDMNNVVMLVADGPYTDLVDEDGSKITKAVVMHKVLADKGANWLRVNRKVCVDINQIVDFKITEKTAEVSININNGLTKVVFSRRRWKNLGDDLKIKIRKLIYEKANYGNGADSCCKICKCTNKCRPATK